MYDLCCYSKDKYLTINGWNCLTGRETLVNIWDGIYNTTTLAKCVPDQHAIISFNVLGLTRLSPARRHFAVAAVLAPLTGYFRNCGIMNNIVSLREFTTRAGESVGCVELSLRLQINSNDCIMIV